jgi:hypothetical protein
MKFCAATLSPLWLLSLLAMSCSVEMNEQEYVSWIQNYENGLHATKKSGELVFDLQYQPAAYLELQQNAGAHAIDSLQYYLLNIGVEGGRVDVARHRATNEVELQRLQYYFSYNFQNDIFLEEEGVRVSCVLFHHEQSLKSKNLKTFALAFPNKFPDSEKAKLVIESEVFGSLPIKIKIKKETPRLKKI